MSTVAATPATHAAAAEPPGAADPAEDTDGIPVRDWQGRAIDCSTCPHADLLGRPAGCAPGHSCMQDAYARRIDRFFTRHPQRAGQHLAHPYFEVRAIAARHADLFALPALLDDPDETVRLQLALRLPQRQLSRLRNDPHREVRLRVAWRLADAELPTMASDPDDAVRLVVARRLPTALLPLLLRDSDRQVRCEVARRLPMPALWQLVGDPAAEVRREVAERLPEPLLQTCAADDDWLVRHAAARRASGAVLATLLHDPEPDVREAAAERQAVLRAAAPAPQPVPLEPRHGRHQP